MYKIHHHMFSINCKYIKFVWISVSKRNYNFKAEMRNNNIITFEKKKLATFNVNMNIVSWLSHTYYFN